MKLVRRLLPQRVRKALRRAKAALVVTYREYEEFKKKHPADHARAQAERIGQYD